jgi:hypothetical protein
MASYPTDIRIFIDDEDVTYWLFGTETISPTDADNIYRDIDVSGFVRGAGYHTLRIESGAGVGRVEARLEID